MIVARAGSGWQTVLADLSLILFMVTASALSSQPEASPPPAAPSPLAEPLALYRAELGSPPLADWLALQAPDERQQLSITVPYHPGELEAALRRAGALAHAAGAAHAQARIVIELGEGPATASLAYDAPAVPPGLARHGLARGLLGQADTHPPKGTRP